MDLLSAKIPQILSGKFTKELSGHLLTACSLMGLTGCASNFEQLNPTQLDSNPLPFVDSYTPPPGFPQRLVDITPQEQGTQYRNGSLLPLDDVIKGPLSNYFLHVPTRTIVRNPSVPVSSEKDLLERFGYPPSFPARLRNLSKKDALQKSANGELMNLENAIGDSPSAFRIDIPTRRLVRPAVKK